MDWSNYECEGQMSLFDLFKTPLVITKPIYLIELFAGVGSQLMSLKRLEKEGLCKINKTLAVEIDKYAIKSYNAIHGTNFETMDITQLHGSDLNIDDNTNQTVILTYSFPCQSLSLAGRGDGMKKGSGTRSGLLWEVERLLTECEKLPNILLMENVPQVHASKNINDFNDWCRFLESLGYSNYWDDLNAKDYGVAQNRNRCFMVSCLGNYTYRFPKPIELTKCMADYLDDVVDEKYYVSTERAERLIEKLVLDGTLE